MIISHKDTSAKYENGKIQILLESGVEIHFPIKGNKRLENSSDELLNDIEISPSGIHWPKLNEDLSFQGLLRGDYGQFLK